MLGHVLSWWNPASPERAGRAYATSGTCGTAPSPTARDDPAGGGRGRHDRPGVDVPGHPHRLADDPRRYPGSRTRRQASAAFVMMRGSVPSGRPSTSIKSTCSGPHGARAAAADPLIRTRPCRSTTATDPQRRARAAAARRAAIPGRSRCRRHGQSVNTTCLGHCARSSTPAKSMYVLSDVDRQRPANGHYRIATAGFSHQLGKWRTRCHRRPRRSRRPGCGHRCSSTSASRPG